MRIASAPSSGLFHRSSATLGVVVVAGALLSACSTPISTITVFTGSGAKTVAGQPACVLLKPTCNYVVNRITTLHVKAGGQILVDVPKKLADDGWIVAAYTSDSSGKNTAIPGAGSPPITGSHSIRVAVPNANVGGYFLQVQALKPSTDLTTWLTAVQLSQ